MAARDRRVSVLSRVISHDRSPAVELDDAKAIALEPGDVVVQMALGMLGAIMETRQQA